MDIFEATIRFFSLTDIHVRYVVLGCILLGSTSGGLGTFAFLQKRALLGDTIAHAALPGVGLAFIITGKKELIFLLIGAVISSWLGALAVNYITHKTKLKLDAALGIVLSVFFGLGIVILTHIQQSGSGSQAGLDKFLFGQAAAMTKNDVIILAIISIAMLILVLLLFNKFKFITFDPGFSSSIGLHVPWLQFLLTTMIVISVTIGLQAVGVVLMAAMLFTPAAAARQWTDNLKLMIFLASFFGAISGILGAYISFLAPQFPTGPWIVVVISCIFIISILFAPKRGLISRMRVHLTNRKKITQDHILKVLYKHNNNKNNWKQFTTFNELMQMWSFTSRELKAGVRRLVKTDKLIKESDMVQLTQDGKVEGARIIRLHRLWEVYLSRYLDIAEDHLHRDAEDMEHIITPEIEKQLLYLLDKPEFDPHKQEIPYPPKEGSS